WSRPPTRPATSARGTLSSSRRTERRNRRKSSRMAQQNRESSLNTTASLTSALPQQGSSGGFPLVPTLRVGTRVGRLLRVVVISEDSQNLGGQSSCQPSPRPKQPRG